MTSVLLCAVPLAGHVAPMLGVAQALGERGFRVRVLTGRRFADAVRATGAEHLPLPPDADPDDDLSDVTSAAPGRRRPTGTGSLRATIARVFLDPAPGQFRALTAALAAEPTDAVVAEAAFVGAAALAHVPRDRRPAVVACGIVPLGVMSRDAAPFGLGLPPRGGPLGTARNVALNALVRHVALRRCQRQADETIRALSGRGLDGYFMDWLLAAERIAQLTVAEFEYPRRDLPASLRFVGPASRLAPPRGTTPPWWDELDDSRPVVLVTQGTLANSDLGQLVHPTLDALADAPVNVVVTTGGPPVDVLGPLPANAFAATFVPYDLLMPRVDVFVTNGGYGGIHLALEHGVPVVVAGDTEDKPETAARVAWAGVGVNLRTGTPRPEAVRSAVRQVIGDGRYRQAAGRIGEAIRAAPGGEGLAALVREAIADDGASVPVRGARRVG
ncbi:nucleotide disphospho-sugar-binding domain-containing protein [Actinotalea sp. JY-7885]|uniref:nucleotide disphospho-sugar-binding domain-containing protein n=1 Tax=Actinotalea sp. JY-7885 TaxID=2758576 RepID=UPI00165EAB38|nr:nucleotide disphospho-sugar-binding domain-containing protein [Actinotalea sp. JY-7885]